MFTALRRTLALFALPTLVIVAVAAPASAAIPTLQPVTSTSVSPEALSPQGIIMRDGGICNPRWGC